MSLELIEVAGAIKAGGGRYMSLSEIYLELRLRRGVDCTPDTVLQALHGLDSRGLLFIETLGGVVYYRNLRAVQAANLEGVGCA
jgi:hypothetical protein